MQFANGGHSSHSLRWEGVWRELSCLTRQTAFSVREQSGPSLKSAVKVREILFYFKLENSQVTANLVFNKWLWTNVI
jgi:hypothetical protein